MPCVARRLATLSTLVLLVPLLACGGKSPDEARVAVPAVTNLREAADLMVSQAEQIEGPPAWVSHTRDDGDAVYGVGTARAKRDPGQDLFSAMEGGRNVVIGWLAESGLETKAPLGFSSDLAQDRKRIEFVRVAYDTEGRTWYALAVLEKAREASEAAKRVADLDVMLLERKSVAVDPRTSESDRVRAALTLLHVVDERAQWNARQAYFGGAGTPPPQGLDGDSIVRLARSVLSEHGVRVVVEGASVPGLEPAIATVLGDFYMSVSEFGSGLVYVTLEESTSEAASMELLELDGIMQITLEGEAGRSISRPLRAVTTYDNLDAARARNARIIGEAAREATREAILSMLE
jgi:hypothetical protein